MTLDEVIKRAEEVAEANESLEYIASNCGYCKLGRSQDGFIETCRHPNNIPRGHSWGECDIEHCPMYKESYECAKQHRQLVGWLKELKERREQDERSD